MYVRGRENPIMVNKALQTSPVPAISCVLGTCRAILIPSTMFSHLPSYHSLFLDHSSAPPTNCVLLLNFYSSFSSQIRYSFRKPSLLSSSTDDVGCPLPGFLSLWSVHPISQFRNCLPPPLDPRMTLMCPMYSWNGYNHHPFISAWHEIWYQQGAQYIFGE